MSGYLSPDGLWRWNGTAWEPAGAAHTPQPAPPRSPGRRLPSLVGGLVLLGLGVTVALISALTIVYDANHSPHPIAVSGTISSFDATCIQDYCAHLDQGDSQCFRVYSDDFSPSLPDLRKFQGKAATMWVDRDNYSTSRIAGDPVCNFQVLRIDLPSPSGGNTSYTSPYFTKPQDGPRGFLAIGFVLAAIGAGLILRWRRRTKAAT